MVLKKNKIFKILLFFLLLSILFTYYVQSKSLNSIFYFLKSFQSNEDINTILNVFYLNSKCECKKKKTIQINKYENYYSVKLLEDDKDSAKNVSYNLTKDEFDTFNTTCDLYNVLRRSKSQKVISYSLYGKNKAYYNKLKKLSKDIKSMYPGWLMRVYYNDSIDKSIICEVECLKSDDGSLIDNSDFCNVNDIDLNLKNIEKRNNHLKLNANYIHSMKWRWFPIGDSFVDIFSSRDTDSYILQREVDSVNVWLNSNKVGHIMRG